MNKFTDALNEIFDNETCKWVTIGGFFRFIGGYTISYFLPRYFNLIWAGEEYVTMFSISYAFVMSIFGFCSQMLGGYIGDIYESKGIVMTKAYICLFSGVFGSIFFCLMTLI